MNAGDPCPYCTAMVAISTDVPKPHHAMLQCTGEVPHFFGFIAGEWTIERALAWTFYFGKYLGRTLEQVNKIDRGYLEWISRWKEDKAPREACRVILAQPKNTIQPLPGQASFLEEAV